MREEQGNEHAERRCADGTSGCLGTSACVDEVDAEVLGLLELRAEVLESWWGLVQDLDVLQAVARLCSIRAEQTGEERGVGEKDVIPDPETIQVP